MQGGRITGGEGGEVHMGVRMYDGGNGRGRPGVRECMMGVSGIFLGVF